MCCFVIPYIVLMGILVSVVAAKRELRGMESAPSADLPTQAAIEVKATALGIRTGLYAGLVVVALLAIILYVDLRHGVNHDAALALISIAITAGMSGSLMGIVAGGNYAQRMNKGLEAIRARLEDEHNPSD